MQILQHSGQVVVIPGCLAHQVGFVGDYMHIYTGKSVDFKQNERVTFVYLESEIYCVQYGLVKVTT